MKIAPLLERKGIKFIAKSVTTLDAAGSKLTLSGGQPDEQVLPYDYLVIATGPKLSFDEVPGAGRMAGTPIPSARWTMPKPSGGITRSS